MQSDGFSVLYIHHLFLLKLLLSPQVIVFCLRRCQVIHPSLIQYHDLVLSGIQTRSRPSLQNMPFFVIEVVFNLLIKQNRIMDDCGKILIRFISHKVLWQVPAILLEIWWFFIDHCYINRLVFWNCIFLFTDIAQLWKCKKCTYMVNVSLQLMHLIIILCGPSCWALFDHLLWFLFQSTLHMSYYIYFEDLYTENTKLSLQGMKLTWGYHDTMGTALNLQ